MLRIAVVAVEFGRAFAEVLVVAGRAESIVALDRVAKTGGIDVDFAGERVERVGLDDITVGDRPAPQRRY